MERDIILLGGKPGSGKSRLGRELAAELEPGISAEHLSLGEQVRAIGRGALSSYSREVIAHLDSPHPEKPLPDELAYGLVSEALVRADEAHLILLDGYPRYASQIESVYELAIKDERWLDGMIITDTNDEIALARMLKRNERNAYRYTKVEPSQARARLLNYETLTRPAYEEFRARNLPIEVIDTSYSKQTTTNRGLAAVAYMLIAREVT